MKQERREMLSRLRTSSGKYSCYNCANMSEPGTSADKNYTFTQRCKYHHLIISNGQGEDMEYLPRRRDDKYEKSYNWNNDNLRQWGPIADTEAERDLMRIAVKNAVIPCEHYVEKPK